MLSRAREVSWESKLLETQHLAYSSYGHCDFDNKCRDSFPEPEGHAHIVEDQSGVIMRL
jgi:hypothetical protein